MLDVATVRLDEITLVDNLLDGWGGMVAALDAIAFQPKATPTE